MGLPVARVEVGVADGVEWESAALPHFCGRSAQTPHANRTYPSLSIRLSLFAPLQGYFLLKTMMNLLVAIVADHHRFASFRNHNLLPKLFSLQIFLPCSHDGFRIYLCPFCRRVRTL